MIGKLATSFRIIRMRGIGAYLAFFKLKILQGLIGISLIPFRLDARKDPSRLEMQADS
jgi:hypothetical protein